MTSFNCLLLNVGCDNRDLCDSGHCMLFDSEKQFNKKDIDEYFDFIKDYKISVGMFQEVCNNEMSGIRDTILAKFEKYNLSPYKGELRKIFKNDDKYNKIKSDDLNRIDNDDIDYQSYLELEPGETSIIEISKDMITATNECELYNLFDLILEHSKIKTYNKFPYNNIKGCPFGEHYIENNDYFYRLDDVKNKINFIVQINDFYAVSPFKYFRVDFVNVHEQYIIFINIHISPYINMFDNSNIKYSIIESIIAIINEIKKHLLVNPHIIICGDFNEGKYFRLGCEKNKYISPYTDGNNHILSNELKKRLGLNDAKRQIIDIYEKFNCTRNPHADRKKCHMNILYSSSLEIKILEQNIRNSFFVNNISSHLPILFECIFIDTTIFMVNECNGIAKIIKKLCIKNKFCSNLDPNRVILLLHSKITETSKTYYEFAKKSVNLCVFNANIMSIYDEISQVLINGKNLDEIITGIFDIMIKNYDNENINDESYNSYYFKYIKYKNKYNKIKYGNKNI